LSKKTTNQPAKNPFSAEGAKAGFFQIIWNYYALAAPVFDAQPETL
jgi:hypothetical protein